MTRRVVVTGLGVVTPLGCELERVWERVLAGESGVTAPLRHASFEPPTRAVGEMKPDDLARLRADHPEAAAAGEMRTLYGAAAGTLAVRDAGLDDGPHPRAGAVIGSGPGVHRLEDYDRWLDADGKLDTLRMGRELDAVEAESLMRNAAEQPAAILAGKHGLGGPVHAVTTACSAANQALGLAFRSVRRGEADWIVAGGTDGMVNPMGLVFFVLLGAGATVDGDPSTACRPFDRKRSGLVLGEGAGAAVFEALEHAEARGAHIYAEVVGYGASMDAHRTTAPWRDGRGAAAAMGAALHDAGLDPEDIDYVSAHGTGTKRNDPAEAAGIRTVFGERAARLAVSAVKGGLGHLLSGAGGVAFACTALAVERDLVPPTANLTDPDPSCGLDFVLGRGRRQPVRAAINNAFAFGGQNSTIVLRAYGKEEA